MAYNNLPMTGFGPVGDMINIGRLIMGLATEDKSIGRAKQSRDIHAQIGEDVKNLGVDETVKKWAGQKIPHIDGKHFFTIDEKYLRTQMPQAFNNTSAVRASVDNLLSLSPGDRMLVNAASNPNLSSDQANALLDRGSEVLQSDEWRAEYNRLAGAATESINAENWAPPGAVTLPRGGDYWGQGEKPDYGFSHTKPDDVTSTDDGGGGGGGNTTLGDTIKPGATVPSGEGGVTTTPTPSPTINIPGFDPEAVLADLINRGLIDPATPDPVTGGDTIQPGGVVPSGNVEGQDPGPGDGTGTGEDPTVKDPDPKPDPNPAEDPAMLILAIAAGFTNVADYLASLEQPTDPDPTDNQKPNPKPNPDPRPGDGGGAGDGTGSGDGTGDDPGDGNGKLPKPKPSKGSSFGAAIGGSPGGPSSTSGKKTQVSDPSTVSLGPTLAAPVNVNPAQIPGIGPIPKSIGELLQQWGIQL